MHYKIDTNNLVKSFTEAIKLRSSAVRKKDSSKIGSRQSDSSFSVPAKVIHLKSGPAKRLQLTFLEFYRRHKKLVDIWSTWHGKLFLFSLCRVRYSTHFHKKVDAHSFAQSKIFIDNRSWILLTPLLVPAKRIQLLAGSICKFCKGNMLLQKVSAPVGFFWLVTKIIILHRFKNGKSFLTTLSMSKLPLILNICLNLDQSSLILQLVATLNTIFICFTFSLCVNLLSNHS